MVPVLPAKSMTHNKSFLDRLQRVEKHLRKNKLKLTLTQRLGNAQDEDEVRCRAPLDMTSVACYIAVNSEFLTFCMFHT